MTKTIYFIISFVVGSISLSAANRIPIKIEHHLEGAPITLGIPFKKGELLSPDHARVLNKNGEEIPSQITQVTSWEPLDYSAKWIWVFFFAEKEDNYTLEYGPEIRRAPIQGPRVKIKNGQRRGQPAIVETGALRFTVNKRTGGFIDDVMLDLDANGYDINDTIATSKDNRGSFLDILDDAGIDASTAHIHRTVKEKGSGPLHSILRIEGEYTYANEDNNSSPFTIRIHVYAGKSYIKAYHTITYTGNPDKHSPVEGEHMMVALTDGVMKPDTASDDKGWLEPDDRIKATGLTLDYNLSGLKTFKSGYLQGEWYDAKDPQIFDTKIDDQQNISIFQNGPKPDRIPPVPNSTADSRIDGFNGLISDNLEKHRSIDKLEGWSDISDEKWGIGIGIKNFIEEYPKEIDIDFEKGSCTAYTWSPNADPMSFARSNGRRDQQMVANMAQGVTKTSEIAIYFHAADENNNDLKRTLNYVIDPPIPHAAPSVYSNSTVYGRFSPESESHSELERSLEYKFDWNIYNQHWEPWYGMFDYGDQKNYYGRGDWFRWINNEPAVDFQYWLQFMRTGDPKYYKAAEAMSRHTMDVDNIHWPTNPKYYGDTNPSLDWWKNQSNQDKATPYLGVGRRHANQHWSAILSAHVWLEGWIASYYLTGYHRGLDIARLTADSYTRRIWGDHDLTGRRLYLAIWNLVEAWDATKDQRYLDDLQDRIDRILALQNGPDQYDALVIDRYGYSQIYASHGLYKYYQLTGEERVRQALIRHARAVRDNPPYNHDFESYLASIHPLLVGYEFTGNQCFLDEAKHRAKSLSTEKLETSFAELGSQGKIAEVLLAADHMPKKGDFSKPKKEIFLSHPDSV